MAHTIAFEALNDFGYVMQIKPEVYEVRIHVGSAAYCVGSTNSLESACRCLCRMSAYRRKSIAFCTAVV